MQVTRKTAPRLGLAALAALGLAAAHPQAACAQIVKNGNFDTDSLSPWTVSTARDTIVFDYNGPAQAHSGNYSAFISNNGTEAGSAPGTGTLTQALGTSAGATYTLTFYAQSFSPSASSLPLTVDSGAGTPQSASHVFSVPTDQVYREYDLSGLTAGGASTALSFVTNLNLLAPYGFHIDDVSVTPAAPAVPEPSSLAAFAFAGLGTAGLMLRARKRQGLSA